VRGISTGSSPRSRKLPRILGAASIRGLIRRG